MEGKDLQAERAAADRAYNDALTRLDRCIQQLPKEFPQPPSAPDPHQIAPLNTLWKIDAPPVRGLRGKFAAAVRRVVAPLFEQQQAFNSAVVDHINRNVAALQQTHDAVDAILALQRTHIEDLVRFESVLVMFLQQITPYVDTRDRDVAGLLRGLSGAIDAVAGELLKRTEAMLARDRRHELQVASVAEESSGLGTRLAALEASVNELRGQLARRDAS
ncbi:MAG TPA: hypothetical protein VGJ29_13010 [Vicinamibacterales bacterium]